MNKPLHTCVICFWYTEEVVIHEFASLCLANMSAEYTSKVQIFEQGGLEPLIRLLSSPDPDVKKNSIECIYNLVQVRLIFNNEFWQKLVIEFIFPLKKDKALKKGPVLIKITPSQYYLVVIIQRKNNGSLESIPFSFHVL